MSRKTARRERAAARTAPAPPRSRLSELPRRWLYGGLGAVTAGIVVALVLASQLGGGSAELSAPLAGGEEAAISGDETAALLEGIPQEGLSLGSADAPVVLYEFADLQCPFCGQWSADVFPTLVEEYVRPGELRIVFRGLAFLGPDSDKALRVVLAAAEQDRLWYAVDLLYRNQGGENDGWVTDGLIAAVGRAVPGLDLERMLAARESDAVEGEIAAAAQDASAADIRSTPSFLIGAADGSVQRLEFESYTADPFRAAIAELLAS
jgi:protein-disulfide isomerase